MRGIAWTVGGQEYPYLVPTEGHERDIEMPWGRRLLARARGRTLEVGNCTQRIWPDLPRRDIVCQYDELGGTQTVHREDICYFDRGVRYNLIVSLSTFEHVGNEYGPYIDSKAIEAVTHCMRLLAPRGRLAFTIPCGFHGALERWVVDHRDDWRSLALMVRVSDDNEWVERPVEEHACGYPGGWGCAGKILMVVM